MSLAVEERRRVAVLGAGYVELIDVLGDDQRVLDAAKKSYDLDAGALDARGEARIRDLARRHHNVFRHCALTFEVKAPLLVAREWWRYVVGSDHTIQGWNELSRRFVRKPPEFYTPDDWGTGNSYVEDGTDEAWRAHVRASVNLYKEALEGGVQPERARLFLPAYGLYTRWWWTASLEAVLLFLRQRWADEQAAPGTVQPEMVAYAEAVKGLTEPLFPITLSALVSA